MQDNYMQKSTFYDCCIGTFTEAKYLSTSSTTVFNRYNAYQVKGPLLLDRWKKNNQCSLVQGKKY